jgi:type VI secretion system secreted protein VgrG
VKLEGANIDFVCPGSFTVKGAAHEWGGGASGAATPPHLPTGLEKVPPTKAQFRHVYHDGEPVQGAEYVATLGDGSKRTGRLDAQGFVQLDDVPAGGIDVTVGPDVRPYQAFKLPATPDEDTSLWMGSQA